MHIPRPAASKVNQYFTITSYSMTTVPSYSMTVWQHRAVWYGVVFGAYCAYCILRGPIQQSQNDSRIEYGR